MCFVLVYLCWTRCLRVLRVALQGLLQREEGTKEKGRAAKKILERKEKKRKSKRKELEVDAGKRSNKPENLSLVLRTAVISSNKSILGADGFLFSSCALLKRIRKGEIRKGKIRKLKEEKKEEKKKREKLRCKGRRGVEAEAFEAAIKCSLSI